MKRAAVLAACLIGWIGPAAPAQEPGYRSPYGVEFTYPVAELIGDLERTERGDPRLEAEIPFAHWYSKRTLERWHSWGPEPRTYPVPRAVEGWPVERLRERVIATALRFQGYAYQHHHIPDWDPPASWPWQKTCAGRDGKGVDCSNLTGFVYNQGFGLRLNTEVHHQSEEQAAREAGGRSHRLHRVELPDGYEDRLRTLRTGDLVFIRNRGGKISHVVIWVGPIGRSPDGVPLIIDSHGEDVRDSNGRPIPCGVQLRPFRENSWYNKSASHAVRVFRD
ncbi:NlpC/P60 family protein [Aquisphaera giovannonii]|uniref:NlpC/P60 family protein n=1 Tax=Aquisphaera giovannonii TaxID=406548 RepID=A0A5B9WED6_9BACT|nr:NlpC/P60 family protein [Aquisphaera giovannonii]QEH38942.1 NlpC/P60 family protein [Aquisphaera giovannonii]